ncbi:MAG: glycosyltransferase family 39 protein [Synergistaceae bacterium]|nr:glycosyltransferase family 39 protein [Synergistaceae bacterium]
MQKDRFRAMALLLFVSAFLFFLFLGNHPLLEPDEGRYSEIPREMIERGDFITPTLNYVKYFEKPVLHYWLTALSFKLFGYTEFASRFWPALLGVLGTAVTFWLASSLYGTRAGFFSGFILATSWIYFAIAQINIIDMGVSVFMTMALAGFFLGATGDRRCFLLFYGGMALATLSKGLIGIVLPCAVAGAWILATRNWKVIRKTLYGWGILLFLGLTLPWYIAVCLKNPEFFHFFFIREHFLRYTTRIHDRYEPAWFFIPILLAGGVPWTAFWVRPLLGVRESRERLYLSLWFAIIFIFFSLSSSKLIPYILPVFPALSILAGHKLDRYLTHPHADGIATELVMTTLLMGLLSGALIAYPFFQDRFSAGVLLRVTVPLAGTLLLTLFATWASWRKHRTNAVVASLFIGALFTCLALKGGFAFYGTFLSAKQTAEIIEKARQPGDMIVSYEDYDQGIPFYLKTRVVLVNWLGELEFGSKIGDQSEWFIDRETFMKRWESNRHMIVIFREKRYKDMLAKGVGNMRVLGRANDAVVVTNRPEEGAQ